MFTRSSRQALKSEEATASACPFRGAADGKPNNGVNKQQPEFDNLENKNSSCDQKYKPLDKNAGGTAACSGGT